MLVSSTDKICTFIITWSEVERKFDFGLTKVRVATHVFCSIKQQNSFFLSFFGETLSMKNSEPGIGEFQVYDAFSVRGIVDNGNEVSFLSNLSFWTLGHGAKASESKDLFDTFSLNATPRRWLEEVENLTPLKYSGVQRYKNLSQLRIGNSRL
mmetsp:Transcript_9761/g.11125  ORF Transcript_9761/g.11125 Transcript_9761/m.11125 type:complete len:153 (+) Transcript_9761:307-765(+)